MTGVAAQGTIEGMDKLQDALKATIAAGIDPSAIFRLIGERMLKMIKRTHFSAKQNAAGVAWPPLKPSTIAARRRKGGGAKPLLDTGNMRDRIVKATTSFEAVVGVNVPYARFQNFGTVSIPAREFMYINADEVPIMVSMLNRFVLKRMGGGGF